jgi:hypothetical protein
MYSAQCRWDIDDDCFHVACGFTTALVVWKPIQWREEHGLSPSLGLGLGLSRVAQRDPPPRRFLITP